MEIAYTCITIKHLHAIWYWYFYSATKQTNILYIILILHYSLVKKFWLLQNRCVMKCIYKCTVSITVTTIHRFYVRSALSDSVRDTTLPAKASSMMRLSRGRLCLCAILIRWSTGLPSLSEVCCNVRTMLLMRFRQQEVSRYKSMGR